MPRPTGMQWLDDINADLRQMKELGAKDYGYGRVMLNANNNSTVHI
jgi:hypothetical protein